MYKLFLTFRYLTRKKIVIFPILVVWLCVMMLIIVTSIMGGFVDRVRSANRNLYGDIIISSASSSQGFSGYDDVSQKLLTDPRFKGKIKAITPVVEAFALMFVPDYRQSVPTLLVGVRPIERSQVTNFRETLFNQYQAPMEAVEDLQERLPATAEQLVAYARDHLMDAQNDRDAAERALDAVTHGSDPVAAYPRAIWLLLVAPIALILFLRARKRRNAWMYVNATFITLLSLGIVALAIFWPVLFPREFDVAEDNAVQVQERLFRTLRTIDYAENLPKGNYATRDDLIKAIVPSTPSFDTTAARKLDNSLPEEGCIAGAQLLIFERDRRGNFIHRYPYEPLKVSLSVLPPSKSGRISLGSATAVTQDFSLVDESHSGVYDVDSLNSYAPFETVQLMAGMRPDPKIVAQDPTADFAPRCHQLLIRLTPEGVANIGQIRRQIDDVVSDFQDEQKKANPTDAFQRRLVVQTWDEKQARYLSAVTNEKTMLTFIMLLMSVVVLVVIFLIFYQIVRDKTRDIGIIKAVGGSEEGVATIFLSYGLMIGLVGGGLGVLTGCLFVTHTNEIHEFIFHTTGIIIWDRSVYLFDRIPDVVHLSDVIIYYSVAVVAGVLGALIPAIVAAFEDPVQAVRYE